jgi:DNA-binding CsgD family transcriptional regulator
MERISSHIPCDAYTFALTDPDTGLLTHAVTRDVPAQVFRLWSEHLYPHHVAGEIIDLARAGTTVSAQPSDVSVDLLRSQGLAHDLRGIASRRGVPWGFLCLLRENSDRGFSDDEVSLLDRVVPEVTEGLRTSVALDRAFSDEAASPEAVEPGVLILDGAGRIETRSPSADTYLRDLGDLGRSDEALPLAVASAVANLRRTRELGSAHPGSLKVRGRSGRWCSIRAMLSEPGVDGRVRWIVLLERARRHEVAPVLTRLYGLTPREREVLALVARGWSTRAVARELGISPYTVQEHVGNACDKVGVRSRKALLAKLYFDAYAPGPFTSAPVGA